MLVVILIAIAVLTVGVWNMSANVDRLRADVANNSSAVDSAVALIVGLTAQLRAALAGNNLESDVGAIADQLEASSAKLGAAVAQNTAAADDSDVIDQSGNTIEGADDQPTTQPNPPADAGPGTTTGSDTTAFTPPTDSTTVATQPSDPSQGAPDGNVPTSDPGAGLNPNTSPSETSVAPPAQVQTDPNV